MTHCIPISVALVSKFIDAIGEAVEPRLKELHPLDEFKAIFPKVDLKEGDKILLEIRGDKLILHTANGGGTVLSKHFALAMCDVFFGSNPVSPELKESVLKGNPHL